MNLFIKRFFDILISCLALVILSPLFLAVAAAIKINSKGPVFFMQERLTKHGKKFKMFKFRSMYINSESTGTGLFNYENDPRVTPVGRFLRNSSIDELPQLINVLSGSMTLIGPRPPVTYELGDFETLIPRYKKRFDFKAGITGLAQISGRNVSGWDQKVNYDNDYIDSFKKYGVLEDIKILLFTIVNVFKSKDIYEEKVSEEMDEEASAEAAAAVVIARAHGIAYGEAHENAHGEDVR